MEITSEQLRYLREQRGLSRESLAEWLGDCSASTVNKWERGINPVPAWVAEKMFSELPIEFSIEELAELFSICRELNCTISELFGTSVRNLITERRNKLLDSTKAEDLPADRPFYQRPDLTALVAEDPPSGTTADPYRAAARDFLQKNSPASPPPAPGSAAAASHPRSRGTPPPKRAGK